jgi:hypothetical protein
VEAAVKRPPFLGTWLAAAVLAGLGAYIYFVENKRELEPEKAKEKVFAFDTAKVESVSLSVPGQPEVRVVREKEGWRMTAPMAVAADAGEADALVTTLSALERDAVVVETPEDPAEFGLASPRSTVSVRLQGTAEPLTVPLGDQTPDGASLYAINKIGARVSAEAQRVLADVAMLLPLPVFYVSTI